MKNHLLILAFSFLAAGAFSQEHSKRLTLFDAGITYGTQIGPELKFNKDDWKTLMPDAPDPTTTDTGFYSSYPYNSTSIAANTLFGAQVQYKLNPREGSRRKSTLLIGLNINYSDCSSARTSYLRSHSSVTDTLTSSQTGEQFYVMSDTLESYYNRYSADRLCVGGSFLLSTNTDRIISGYVGGRLQLGVSLSRKAEYGYYKAVYTRQTNSAGYGGGADSYEGSATSRTTKTVTYAGILVPFGLTCRLGKAGVFSHLSVTWENTVGVYLTNVPELRTFTTYAFSTGFRLNYRF